jgi:site-specific recombinase XerD
MIYFTFVADFVEFIQDKPLDELSNLEVRLFVEHQVEKKKYSINTHRQMVSALKHFGVYLPESDIEVESLPQPSKSKFLPTVLSKEEIIEVIRNTRNIKHRTIIALIYSAGLRVGEVIDLELRNIDIDRMQLYIKSAKGRKDRVIFIAKSFIPLYYNYQMTYRPSKYFIEGPNGGKYTAGSIRKFLKRACKNAGIRKRVTPHTLRHSFATHLIEDGVGIRHVQELLGHSKPETTMIYTHIAKKDLLNIESPLDKVVFELQRTDKKHLNHPFSRNLIR